MIVESLGHPEKPLVNGFRIILKFIIFNNAYVHTEARAGMSMSASYYCIKILLSSRTRKFLTDKFLLKKFS
jgi:hypothetical protein